MRFTVVVRKACMLPTPAKLNLGLEVLGKRPDGYHEIITIIQAIDWCDFLHWAPAPELQYESPPELGDDLVARALRLLGAAGVTIRASIRLVKQIPLAAGLGGGSSNAGTLLGALVQAGLPANLVQEIAETLGSDVPFFLQNGTALARGRGTELETLPAPPGWFVVVLPELTLSSKTRRLYAALTPADYSDGTATLRQAERLRQGHGLDPLLIRNAFLRPLMAFQAFERAFTTLQSAGARWVWPSGAGPALFSWCPRRETATGLARTLQEQGFLTKVAAPYTVPWASIVGALEVIPEERTL